MIDQAQAEDRVILTCDSTFIRARYTEQAYMLGRTDKYAQLEEVVEYFQLHIDGDDLLSRCAKCNGEFIPRSVVQALVASSWRFLCLLHRPLQRSEMRQKSNTSAQPNRSSHHATLHICTAGALNHLILKRCISDQAPLAGALQKALSGLA